MKSLSPGHPQGRSLALRRQERELFFWTAREALKLVVLIALTSYFIVSLAEGRIAGYEELLELAAKIITFLR